MKVTINGKDLIIKFRYTRRHKNARIHTVCNIGELVPLAIPAYNDKSTVVTNISTGEVACDSRQPFVKKHGRKRALAVALGNSDFTRSCRKEMWNQYFAITHELTKNKKAA